jgi:hypothetical protein
VYLYGSEIEENAIKATYVGGSLYYDIAVLHIKESEMLMSSNACAVDVADSDNIVVGDSAIAIGNAQGLGISSTAGIVSVDSEYITMTAADGKNEVSFRVMRVDTAINSGNSVVRNFAERNAINAPIQGSSADMIKIAMTNIYNEMKLRDLKSKMILQVHDELVFDVCKNELDVLSELVTDKMINALQLDIPVIVNINTGNNWLEAH